MAIGNLPYTTNNYIKYLKPKQSLRYQIKLEEIARYNIKGFILANVLKIIQKLNQNKTTEKPAKCFGCI